MRNTRKIIVISLLSMLIFGSIGPFYLAYARRTLTITIEANNSDFGDIYYGNAIGTWGEHQVNMCKDFSFTISPKPGYHIQGLWVDDAVNGVDPAFNNVYGDQEYTFTKVKDDHLIHIDFAENAELAFSDPDNSNAILSVFVPTGDAPIPFGFDYLPGTFEALGAAPFFIEVTGTLSGIATITVHYDDSVFGGDNDLEGQLRLYVGNVVDFNNDSTVNGNDVEAIKKMVGTEITEDTPDEIRIFDVNGDDYVDDIDVSIVKEYANSGLVVSPGNYFGDGEYRVAWIDITKDRNMNENIIWGETWHLSIFGCR